MTLGQMDKLIAGMRDMTAAMDNVDVEDAYCEAAEAIWNRPVLVIQGNVIKELVRIAADIKDGKVKAWELIFKEAR